MRETNPSVTGKASHTPVMPPTEDNRKDMGMISKNPRRKERICAGRLRSMDVR